MPRPKSTDTPAKEKILATASDLFYRQGYHQTGTNQIINEADVSKATFYAHFPSKEDLAVAYVRHNALRTIDFIESINKKHQGPIERYLAFYESVCGYMIETDYRGCSFGNIAREFPGKDSRIRLEVESFENEYRQMLREAVQGVFEAQPELFEAVGLSVQQVSDRYYLLLEGAISACTNFHDTWPLKAAGEAIRDLLKINNTHPR